jgi:uncharacterized protein YbjT (DUF2867 family)
MRLLVTGAAGVLGREVLVAAQSAGIVVRAMSRRTPSGTAGEEWVRADLVDGEGLDAAVDANVRHLIFVSIVGVDAVPIAYYKRKLAAEQIVGAGRVPFSILRATQFHSFLEQLIAGTAKFPFIVPVPTGIVVQPVEVSEVAERLMRCVAEGPRGRVNDFGGPEVLSWPDAVEQWRTARRVSKRLIPIPYLGATAKALRAGLGTAPNGDRGTISWREWLMNTRDR